MTSLALSYDPYNIEAETLCSAIQAEYWGRDLSDKQILTSLQHSYCISGWVDGRQIGFARAVSDRSTCAHIKDFIVFPDYRGRGFGKRLMTGLFAHPLLSEVGSWFLGTQDARVFYERFGFKASSNAVHMYLHLRDAE